MASLEKFARERYMMKKANEDLFVFVSEKRKIEPASRCNFRSNTYWANTFSASIYCLLCIARCHLLFLIHYLGFINQFISTKNQLNIISDLNKIKYYQNLSISGKSFFYHRVIVFIMNKHFFGDGINLSNEVKTYISASAVQLTFRIRGFYIEHIQLIRVFPKAIWSQLAQHEVKGLTTGGGVMWLSWPDIKKDLIFLMMELILEFMKWRTPLN